MKREITEDEARAYKGRVIVRLSGEGRQFFVEEDQPLTIDPAMLDHINTVLVYLMAYNDHSPSWNMADAIDHLGAARELLGGESFPDGGV